MSLSTSDFSAFFKEVHDGLEPFRWQAALAKKVCHTGEWPEGLNLPTGSGKTSVIDVAVFHLAQEAAKKQDRNAPIRIVFVVDRRLVVDDVFEHASRIATKIQESNGPVTKKVAEALSMLSTTGEPLRVVKIRGGMVQEPDWAKTPAQPLIIVSTIDQAGSRLLFRGYGVSQSMRPVHAGLLGTDVLYILDEAHTSQPFCDTMKKVRQIMQSNNVLRPFKFVSMSATLPSGSLFPPENSNMLSGDSCLQKRMSAHKYAKLEKTNTSQQYDKFVKFALDLAGPDDVKSVGIVVNRVGAARRIFLQMREKLKGHSLGECEVHLLIGRARPLERDMFVKNKLNQIRNEANVTVDKIFFVATQCIEVGVDVSFDALVTQIAPIDSLRQRFGRLNRIGKFEESKAVIVAVGNEILTKNKSDPIYGDVLPLAWKYLCDLRNENDEIDFGIKYFNPKEPKVSAPRPNSVTLFPSYVDLWAQTRPPPHPDPAPQFFLHGKDTKSPDVQVIWRTDIILESERYHQTLVSPPSQLEAVSIPIWTVKKWLSKKTDGMVGDVEGVPEPEEDNDSRVSSRKVLLWHGKKSPRTKIGDSKDIIPGDTIIVPSSYGGCDKYGWDDNSSDEVKDIGTESNLVQRRRITLRLNEQMIKSVCGHEMWSQVQKITEKYAESPDYDEMISSLRDMVGIPKTWGRMLDIMSRDVSLVGVEKTSEGDETWITGITYKKKIQLPEIDDIFSDSDEVGIHESAKHENTHSESSTDEEHESGSGVKTVSLIHHSEGVREHVNMFGTHIGLDSAILDDVKIAAFLHDSGKAEKRVQALLRKQDSDELYDHNLLAKGISSTDSLEEYNKCLDRAHLPRGYRHECWSVNLAKNHPNIGSANDHELVLYLIGTHHGYGRPWFPAINDVHYDGTDVFLFDGVEAKSDYETTSIDSGWIDMVNRLGHRYGWWQLAYLEMLLRLADHRQSEKEQKT